MKILKALTAPTLLVLSVSCSDGNSHTSTIAETATIVGASTLLDPNTINEDTLTGLWASDCVTIKGRVITDKDGHVTQEPDTYNVFQETFIKGVEIGTLIAYQDADCKVVTSFLHTRSEIRSVRQLDKSICAAEGHKAAYCDKSMEIAYKGIYKGTWVNIGEFDFSAAIDVKALDFESHEMDWEDVAATFDIEKDVQGKLTLTTNNGGKDMIFSKIK